jgi:hypothetical protein
VHTVAVLVHTVAVLVHTVAAAVPEGILVAGRSFAPVEPGIDHTQALVAGMLQHRIVVVCMGSRWDILCLCVRVCLCVCMYVCDPSLWGVCKCVFVCMFGNVNVRMYVNITLCRCVCV